MLFPIPLQCVAEYNTEKPGALYGVMSIDFSKSGSLLFAGLDSGNVVGWDVPAGSEIGKNEHEADQPRVCTNTNIESRVCKQTHY